MLTPLKTAAALVLILVCCSCKKNDQPQPSDANNSIVETIPPYLRPITLAINPYIGGYYESIPNHYLSTTKTYPLLLFLHGAGQEGNGGSDLPLLLNDGIIKSISQKTFPPNFNVNGNDFSFVVLAPQMRGMPPDSLVISFLNYAVSHYRIDASRIYIVGMSMGGVVTTQMGSRFSNKFAAAVAVAGASFGSDQAANAQGYASGGLPLWAFHNSGDPVTPSSVTTNFVNKINADGPLVAAKATIFQSTEHDAWTKALDNTYKENNVSVYEWMLRYKR